MDEVENVADDAGKALDAVEEQIEEVVDDVAHLKPVEGASDAAKDAGEDIAGVLKNLHDRVEKLEEHIGMNAPIEEVEAGGEGHSGGDNVVDVAPPEETPQVAEAPSGGIWDILR